MRISIVLTTYNGEKYIEEQLESIILQTRRPDEIIVMDDCSTDNTVNIVKTILDKKDIGISSKIIINETNQGWRKNFINGFHQASGDIIFCADQDDIWYDKKLELMVKTMDENPLINVLACNLTPLYEEGATKLASFYVDNYGQNYLECLSLIRDGFTVLRPGCTICFRKSILPWVYSVWSERLAHDEVIWAVGIITNSIYIINEPLIHFRRHGNNNSPSNAKRIEPRLDRAVCELDKVDAIIEHKKMFNMDLEKMKYLERVRTLDKARIKSFKSNNIFMGLALFRYITYYQSAKGWVADLMCIIHG